MGRVWSSVGFQLFFGQQSILACGANLCWPLGGIICNFTPILPYFWHWGDETRPRFFSGEQIKWRPRNGTHLPNSGKDLRSDAHQSQIIGGNADEDHTQIIGGDTVKLLGGYISPSPRVSIPLLLRLRRLIVSREDVQLTDSFIFKQSLCLFHIYFHLFVDQSLTVLTQLASGAQRAERGPGDSSDSNDFFARK